MVASDENGGFEMNESVYITYKLVMEDLLYGTKNHVINDNIELCRDLKDIFHNKPSKKNLSRFFNNEAIQTLWWSPKWIQSEKLQEILTNSNPIMR